MEYEGLPFLIVRADPDPSLQLIVTRLIFAIDRLMFTINHLNGRSHFGTSYSLVSSHPGGQASSRRLRGGIRLLTNYFPRENSGGVSGL